MIKAWQIARKDLKLLTRDRRAFGVLLVLPVVFITIVGMTTGQLMVWGDDAQKLRIIVVDNVAYDKIGGPLPKELRQADEEIDPEDLEGEEPIADEEVFEELTEDEKQRRRKIAHHLVTRLINQIQGVAGYKLKIMDDAEAARDLVMDSEARAAIIIGPYFFHLVDELHPRDIMVPEQGRLAKGLNSLDIELVARSSLSTTASIIDTNVFNDTRRAIGKYVLCRNNLARRFMRTACEDFEKEIEQPATVNAPPEQELKATTSMKRQGVYQELVPGFTVMFVFFLVNVMARSFISERELGTLRRLKIAPIRVSSLLAGKTIPFFFVSVIQTALLFAFGRFLFDMSWGTEPWALIPVGICTSLAATSLGLLVATMVRTDAQVSAWANIVIIVLAGISGCFMPRDWMPQQLNQISMFTPHAWALIGYDQILRNDVPDMQIIWKSCGMLLAISCGLFTLGCQRFRHMQP